MVLEVPFRRQEKRLALGHYTKAGSNKVAVSLRAARDARDDARKLLRKGTDPAQQRQLEKLTRQVAADTTFEAVARELHATKHSGWSPRYGARWIERMEKDLFPWIGSLALADITAPLLLQTLRRMRAAAPARRRTRCGRPPARCSATASPPGAANATRHPTCTAP